jgi:hypothetical protein
MDGAKENTGTPKAFEVFDEMLPYDCALVVHLDPSGQPLRSISSMAGGTSNVSTRVINALKEANSQISNGCCFKSAPGVVLIIPSEDHADDHMIATAVYGERTG